MSGFSLPTLGTVVNAAGAALQAAARVHDVLRGDAILEPIHKNVTERLPADFQAPERLAGAGARDRSLLKGRQKAKSRRASASVTQWWKQEGENIPLSRCEEVGSVSTTARQADWNSAAKAKSAGVEGGSMAPPALMLISIWNTSSWLACSRYGVTTKGALYWPYRHFQDSIPG